MRAWWVLAITGALLFAPPPSAAQPVGATIQGVVVGLDGGVRRGLSQAAVDVAGPTGRRTVYADREGRYLVEGLSAGAHTVRAEYLGYAATRVEILVPANGTVLLDLVLQAAPMVLDTMRVLASPPEIPTREAESPERQDADALLGVRALEATSGIAESGIPEALRSLPGNDPSDPTDVLLMRGSTTDLKLVLLDGAPVYTPFHSGGLMTSFDVSALGAARHHGGGAPARYDGGLSYILDLRTRTPDGDALRSWGSLDLLSAAAGFESPLTSRAAVVASGRALHDGFGHLVGGDGSPYGYRDGMLRADIELSEATSLALTGFSNREAVRLDLPAAGIQPGIDDAAWGNDVAAVNLRHDAGGFGLEIGTSASRYRAELPVRPPDAPEDDAPPELASGITDRLRFTVDATIPKAEGPLRFGASIDRVGVRYGTGPASRMLEEVRANGWVTGLYLDGVRHLAPELSLRYGGRLDRFQPGGTRGALRAALLWTVAPDAILTLAAGRYHQLSRLADTNAELALGEAVDVGAGPLSFEPSPPLKVASADHLTLSLDQIVSPRVRIGLEGFLKTYQGLATSEGDRLFSSGVDLRVLRSGDQLTGWLGYTLAWFWQNDPSGEPGEFAGRHLLSAGLRGRVRGPLGIDLKLSFSDGLPLTAVSLDQAPIRADNASEDSSGDTRAVPAFADHFLRLDAELYAEWERPWGSRTLSVRPYVKVLNSLDRRDALFYYFEPWRNDGLRPLADLPVVPVVGLRWRF